MNILLLGCGKLGKDLAIKLHNQGHYITCVSKHKKDLPEGITHLCQDIHDLNLKDCPIFDKVYVVLSPKERSLLSYQDIYINTIMPIYQALSHQLEHIKNIIYISSTRVYHHDNGDRIDDDTAILPYENTDAFAKILISAELLYQAYFGNKAIIIRPSGLYSGDSDKLMTLAKDLEYIDDCHYMNLIHRYDVVDFLIYINGLANPMSSYILTAKSYVRGDFLNQLRKQQGLLPIPMANDLPKTGKQIVAKRMHQSGFELKHSIL